MCTGSVVKPAPVYSAKRPPEPPPLPGAFTLQELNRTSAGDLIKRGSGIVNPFQRFGSAIRVGPSKGGRNGGTSKRWEPPWGSPKIG